VVISFAYGHQAHIELMCPEPYSVISDELQFTAAYAVVANHSEIVSKAVVVYFMTICRVMVAIRSTGPTKRECFCRSLVGTQ